MSKVANERNQYQQQQCCFSAIEKSQILRVASEVSVLHLIPFYIIQRYVCISRLNHSLSLMCYLTLGWFSWWVYVTYVGGVWPEYEEVSGRQSSIIVEL